MNEQSSESRATVPVWDGRHESWNHFLVEVKWTLSSMKPAERPLLAARLVRQNLKAGPPSLVQLLYKLDPDDFRKESDVARLIQFLETSPLNKQPLPEAGNRIGAYYRRLHRKPNESVRQYIVREEKVHDDMLKALQRLLRERELDFEQYDCTVEELKEFVGIRHDASVYYGDDEGASVTESQAAEGSSERDRGLHGERDEGDPASRQFPESPIGKEDRSKATPSRGKDLLQRLMEKGLMPLSALDVIRGWLLLETCIPGDDNGKRMVKAATRNKLTYQEIRSALTNMYEDGQQHQRSRNMYYNHMYGEQETEDYEADYNGTYVVESYTTRMMDGQSHGQTRAMTAPSGCTKTGAKTSGLKRTRRPRM